MAGQEPHKLSGLYIAGFIFALGITVGTFWFGYSTQDEGLGNFLTKALGPFFGLVSAGWTADYYHRRDANKIIERDVGKAVYSARSLLQGVYHVDQRLAEASNALNESDTLAALRAVEHAIARTDDNLLQVMKTIREWESLSRSAAVKGAAEFEADVLSINARREQIAIQTNQHEQERGGGNDGS
ncbi:hypothetical protein A5674_27310 [Mycobacterium malmoense]|uniref:hypothetical protein n=1 Tax=Mycobacterium malmoense TaxID=1780 RepID=UPI00080BD085|nr:hypothetical protein [Mycobacterium malmoense]OCB21654.1 hypothetical protein A5674_27310 [Mycobacterium malmoense]